MSSAGQGRAGDQEVERQPCLWEAWRLIDSRLQWVEEP